MRKKSRRKEISYNYIGQCPDCGAYCVAMSTDLIDAERIVKKWRREGLIVSRVSDAFVQENFSRCVCGYPAEAARPRMARLFD